MFCDNCGNQIQPGQTVCPRCGKPVATANQGASSQQSYSASSGQQPPYGQQQPYSQQPPYNQQPYSQQPPYGQRPMRRPGSFTLTLPKLNALMRTNWIGLASAFIGFLSLFMSFVNVGSSGYYAGMTGLQFMRTADDTFMNVLVIIFVLAVAACHIFPFRKFACIGGAGMVFYLIMFIVEYSDLADYSGASLGFGFFVFILCTAGAFVSAFMRDRDS